MSDDNQFEKKDTETAAMSIDKQDIEQFLDSSDANMIRVLDDLIDLLCSQNVIRFTDLPEAARKKLLERRNARDNLSNPTELLLDNDDVL